jgi:hypothetical protein
MVPPPTSVLAAANGAAIRHFKRNSMEKQMFGAADALRRTNGVELTDHDLKAARHSLQKLGFMPSVTTTGEHQTEVHSALLKFGKHMGYTPVQLENESILRDLLAFLHYRFCGTPDTAGGIHPHSYGAPTGRWGNGNLTININPTGCNLASNVINAMVRGAYAQYQSVQPFFSFTPGGPNSNITVQFGGTSLSPRLGTPGGPIGIGLAPSSGKLFLNAGTTWTFQLLLSVVLHEAGHTLGLSHSTLSTSVMYPFAPNLTSLDPETIEAIQSLYGWQPQTRLSDRASTAGPSITAVSKPSWGAGSSSDALFMAWKGTTGDSELYFASSDDGVHWSPQERIDGVGSSDGPALTTFHPPSPDGYPTPGLFMAWKGVSGDANIYWATNVDQQGWSPQQRINGVGTSSRPAVVEFNNQIVMAWKGVSGDSGIYWSRLTGNTWSPQARIVGRGTSHGPALVVFNGQLHMYWKGIQDDDNVYHAILVDPVNGIWGPQDRVAYVDAGNLASGETPIAIGTSDSPVATVRGNEIVLAWKGIPGDDELWFSLFSDGQYSGQMSIPNVGSAAGPSIVNFGGKLVLGWRGIPGDSNLYVSSLG